MPCRAADMIIVVNMIIAFYKLYRCYIIVKSDSVMKTTGNV